MAEDVQEKPKRWSFKDLDKGIAVPPENLSLMARLAKGITGFFATPPKYLRENVIPIFRKKDPSVYYHRKYKRVPGIEECYVDDQVCLFEANQQFLRDWKVEDNILKILMRRFQDCASYHMSNYQVFCMDHIRTYMQAKEKFDLKYGDIGYPPNVRRAYMKQKHRLIWERRRAEGKEKPLSSIDDVL